MWVAGKTVWSPCYTRAVSDFSLLSCVTASCGWAVWLDYNKDSLLYYRDMIFRCVFRRSESVADALLSTMCAVMSTCQQTWQPIIGDHNIHKQPLAQLAEDVTGPCSHGVLLCVAASPSGQLPSRDRKLRPRPTEVGQEDTRQIYVLSRLFGQCNSGGWAKANTPSPQLLPQPVAATAKPCVHRVTLQLTLMTGLWRRLL